MRDRVRIQDEEEVLMEDHVQDGEGPQPLLRASSETVSDDANELAKLELLEIFQNFDLTDRLHLQHVVQVVSTPYGAQSTCSLSITADTVS